MGCRSRMTLWPACQNRREETSGRSHSLNHFTPILSLRELSILFTSSWVGPLTGSFQGPAPHGNRSRGLRSPASRRCREALNGKLERESANRSRGKRGTNPKLAPVGQLHSRRDMRHTSPDTTQTRFRPCHTSPTDWAVVAPPDASCRHCCPNTTRTWSELYS